MKADDESKTTIRQWESMSPAQAAAMDPHGDFAKRWLLNDAVFDLLGDVNGRTVLDAGSGQGYLSRMLASRGASVTAVEPARPLFEHALRKEAELHQGIDLVKADLTTLRLGRRFDAVVMSMVLVSIPDWEAAFTTCVNALRPGGRLVFSLDHPLVSAAHEDWRHDGHLRVSAYGEIRPLPRPVATDFHRPLSTYLNALSDHGLAFERMAEPTLPTTALDDPEAPPHAGVLREVPLFVVISAIKGG